MKRLNVFLIAILTLLLVTPILTVSAQTGNLPWGVERIRGDLPWDKDGDLILDFENRAGKDIRVAVLDTGIWPYRPDLAGRVVDATSFVEGEVWYNDHIGHGTHVAGTIAAINNGTHLVGVAPKVELLIAKVIDKYGQIDDPADVAAAIDWAVGRGAHVIVMAFRLLDDYDDVRNACNDAYNSGKLLIAASGNDGGDVEYPAKYDSVIAVGAIDWDDNRMSSSNYGPELEFVAPGFFINSTNSNLWKPPSLYEIYHVTSPATAHAAGAAALVFGSKVEPEYDFNNNGQWDNLEVQGMLKDTALDLGDTGEDDYYGHGLVNAWYSNQRPPGDINHDGFVGMKDLSRVAYYLLYTPEQPDWWDARPCDIIIDNIVNIMGLTIVSIHYGEFDP